MQVGEGTRTATRMQGELRTAMEATQAAEWHARVRVCRTVCPSGLLGSFLCYRPGLCHCRLRIAI